MITVIVSLHKLDKELNVLVYNGLCDKHYASLELGFINRYSIINMNVVAYMLTLLTINNLSAE